MSYRACRYGNQAAFDLLVSRGAVLTARGRTGVTPLHLACKFKRVDMIKVCINGLSVP